MALNLAAWGNALHSGEKSYGIVRRRVLWFCISGVLVALSIGSLVGNGIQEGIAFTGGTEITIHGVPADSEQTARDAVDVIIPGANPTVVIKNAVLVPEPAASVTAEPSASATLEPAVSATASPDVSASPEPTASVTAPPDGTVTTDPNVVDVLVKLPHVDDAVAEAAKAKLVEVFTVDGVVPDVASEFIGPSWGDDVSHKAVTSLIWFLVLVSVVMSIYFRQWRMAAAALVALAHDLVFTVGVYAALGFEVTPASVIGFLTILGYSLYDTVVVFDKVRENTAPTLSQHRYTYAELANLALNQTLVRSINTSVVALLPVTAILYIGAILMGAGTLKDISLALFVGMAVGTYSSIFVATPIQVALMERDPKIRAHTASVVKSRESGAELDEHGVVKVGPLVRGTHKGIAAQPKRRGRS